MKRLLLTLALCLLASPAFARVVDADRVISLGISPSSFETVAVPDDRLLDTIEVRLQLPTTTQPLAWDANGTMRVTLSVMVDGVEYQSVGQVSGGIRSRNGIEQPEYRLRYRPPYGFFGARGGVSKRIGETGIAPPEVRLTLQRLRGTINTRIVSFSTASSAAPQVAFHNSVAFDTATDAQESPGDGVLSLSHTAGGSNRAVFIGEANSTETVGRTTTLTYQDSTVVELWDAAVLTNYAHAGAYVINPAASAKTVTSTLSGVAVFNEHALGVISMTGVHQTTAVGTPNTATGTTEDTQTVTVASVGSDDLVVDNYYADTTTNAPTVGADQTLRNQELLVDAGIHFRQSTQPGTAGGVMSWTVTDSAAWMTGAVAFKPSDVTGRPGRSPVMFQ